MQKKKPHLLEPRVRRATLTRQNCPGMEQPPVRRAIACPSCGGRSCTAEQIGPFITVRCSRREGMRATNGAVNDSERAQGT